MKKLLLFGTALLTYVGAFAQGYSTTGIHDDFMTTDFYKNGGNLEGIVWWVGEGFTMVRGGDHTQTITADNVGGPGNYPLFGLNFNDSNDDGSGTAFELDLSGGADIQLDIENTSDQLLFMDVKLEDVNGVQAEFEPDTSDLTASSTWNDPERKALIGFTVPAGERKSFIIDLSSVSGLVGGLNLQNGVASYQCDGGPTTCPITDYGIDITSITAVIFRVNFGGDNIFLSEGDGDPTTDTFIEGTSIEAFTGDIVLHDVKIGSTADGIGVGIAEEAIESSITVFPNPAKDVLNVNFNSIEGTEVILSDVLGNELVSVPASVGSNTVSMNTAGLTSGVYVLNVATENGNVARRVFID